MRNKLVLLVVVAAAWFPQATDGRKKPKASKIDQKTPPVELYIRDAHQRAARESGAPGGSIWQPGAALGDLGRDLKASQIDDVVTIMVNERASAVATGVTKTQRASSAQYSVGSLFGKKSTSGALANLANMSGAQALNGQGTTSRGATLSTTMTGRVVDVLPNGYLVLEASKEVLVNSENQIVTVRGVARPYDITPGNQIASDHLAQLELRINGKGVVGDSIKRPFILYRLLMGLLPF